MSHVRTQIRAAIAAALAPVATTHVARLYQIDPATLPVLLVASGQESIGGEFDALERRYQVIVEAVTGGTDAELDALLVGVEEALNGNLGGLVVHLQPVSVEISNSAEGSAPIGRARITYEALYRTSYADPETSI